MMFFTRKISLAYILMLLSFLCISCTKERLAMPSEIQYQWHEQERIMFVCLDPCTWQGREYDDHSTPLSRINPTRLNTNQWCEAAKSWGAREILFVAKHTGGFCWWQTETTDYGIRNTPYKNGQGDVLKELSQSCDKYGLNLGIYVYPGDDTWGAGIGSGGKTADPNKQEAYNQVFRQQLKEVLTRYGPVMELWFDGSCVIDVSDLIEKHCKNTVIFQGPHASLRWPGTESGKLFYPAWNSIRSEDLATGVSTQIHGHPEGDAWAPLEANTTLYDHYWFWAPWKEAKRKSLDALTACYYKSVGRGSVFLLNSTPDTTGLIPAGDMALYAAFGREIKRRFNTPLAGINHEKGDDITVEFSEPTLINHIITMEDYRYGERIREYRIYGSVNGRWIQLADGLSVGRKKIDYFDEVHVTALRLHISKYAAKPQIRSLAAYHVQDFTPPEADSMKVWAKPVELYRWIKADIIGGRIEVELDLSKHINIPGQYIVEVIPDNETDQLLISNAKVFYEGRAALKEFTTVKGNSIHVNRTAQVTGESSSVLTCSVEVTPPLGGKIVFRPALIY